MKKEYELGIYDNQITEKSSEGFHHMNYMSHRRDSVVPKGAGLFWSNYRGNTFFDMLMLKSWEEYFVETEKEFTEFLFSKIPREAIIN